LLRDIPTSIYALKMLRPGTDISPYPWLRHCLQDRIKVWFKLCMQPNILKSNQATKTVIWTYTSKKT